MPFSIAIATRFCRRRHSLFLALAGALAAPFAAYAADVVVQPAAGSGFVVKDSSGANERLRVQETGAISLPALPAAPAQPQGLCMSASGQLGPCSGGTGSSYTAATGLSLAGTTFSVAPTYRLPQGCAANQFAQWDGTTWICGTASGNLPSGTENYTLRYDSSNKLVENYRLQAYEDGGVVAFGGNYPPFVGAIPVEGDGARLMWYPGKAAFRVGYAYLGVWNDGNIGVDSVAMGNQTKASGTVSTALGEVTVASGYVSTAMGRDTVASGDYSTAMGRNVSTNNQSGSFIYGDADTTRSQVTNTAPNQFVVAATGGAYFFTGCGTMCTTGVGLAPGSGSWFSLSDRNAKTAVQPVDGRDVLKKIAALPLNTWQYKTQESKYRHMGPMAQDFYAAFRLGESDKGIDTVDADGVALAAIQGVSAVLADKDREIGELRAELAAQRAESAAQNKRLAEQEGKIAAQQAQIAAQQTRVASLESLAAELAEVKAQVAALRESAPKRVTVALRQP